MPGFSPENINIHDLTVEEPEKEIELPFDSERDITEENWKGIMKDVEDFKGDDSKEDYLFQFLMSIKALKPDIDLQLNDSLWEKAKRVLQKSKTNYHWENFAIEANAIRFLNPNINLGLDEKAREALQAILEKDRAEETWGNFFDTAMQMKILDPNVKLGLSEPIKKEMATILDNDRATDNWSFFPFHAMQAKILDIDFQLSKKDWDGMRASLEQCRELPVWDGFTFQALAMQILAAEEIKLTDRGMEINMRKPILEKDDSLELPEQRKF